MKLYAFDEIDENLQLLPVAARRALDHAGLRLSRQSWQSLPLATRRSLTEIGSGDLIDGARVVSLCQAAQPPGETVPQQLDPPAAAPPMEVTEAFGSERPIATAVWVGLTPLERFALAKVAASARPERLEGAWREIVGASSISTHLEPQGGVRMVDVGEKPVTTREAHAESAVSMSAEAFERLRRADVPKGDVLGTARLAGIMAAKRTSELIPLCHALQLTKVGVELELVEARREVAIRAMARAQDRTGVEMEALVAASVAALTVYDMLKAFDRSMVIGPTRLLSKSGGRTGDFGAKRS